MNGTALFFLGYGAFFGGLAGWWLGRRRERRDARHVRVPELVAALRDMGTAPADDPDLARRARLAYDTAYDEKHPEEWA